MARRVVAFRFAPAELAEIDRRAEAAGLDRTAWVRHRLLGRLVEEDGRLTGERWRSQREPASVPGEVEVGDIVQYMHPDWGAVVGRVLQVDGAPGKVRAWDGPQQMILVQDQAPDGAREWWPLADCVRVDDP